MQLNPLRKNLLKKRKGKTTRKKAQKKNIKKGNHSDFNHVLIESEEEDEENKVVDSQDKEGEGNPVMDNLETANTSNMHKEEKGDKSDNGDKDTVKAFCETIATMVKDVNSLKTDTQAIARITVGDKPLAEHVKELVVVLHNAQAIECMVGKIMAMEKKVNQMGDPEEMENKMKDFSTRIDKLELNVKKIADQNFQILKSSVDNMNILINKFENDADKDGDKEQLNKKGHERRTRANTKKKGDIEGRELEDLKTSANSMKQMVVHAEEIMNSI